MPAPLDDPEFLAAVRSPQFQALSWEIRRKKLSEFIPQFAAASPAEQNSVMGTLQLKANPRPPVPAGLQAKPEEIVAMTDQMVKSGELSAADAAQVHSALAAKGYDPKTVGPWEDYQTMPWQDYAAGAPRQEQKPTPSTLPSYAGADLGAALQPVLDYASAGWDRLKGGVSRMMQPGVDAKLQGTSDAIRGTGQMLAPMALPLAATAGPVAVISGLLGGYAGGAAAGAGARALGAGPGAQSLAEDLGGFGGGAGVNALAARTAPAVGGLLQDAAKTQYARVLNPTTKANKVTTARIVPELLDRGVSAHSVKGLLSRFEDARDSAGQTLNELWSNIPQGATVRLDPVLDAMDRHASESFLSPTGKPLSASADRGIKIVQDLGQRLANESRVDPNTGERVIAAEALRLFRQEWDRITHKAGGFTNTLDDATSAGAHGIGGDAARSTINSEFPQIDAANREYGLWKDASRVMGDTVVRRQGQPVPLVRQLAKAVGIGGGYAAGGVHGGLLAGAALDGLETAGASVPWNTNIARFKYGLGGLLQQTPPAQPVPYWVPGLLGATVAR